MVVALGLLGSTRQHPMFEMDVERFSSVFLKIVRICRGAREQSIQTGSVVFRGMRFRWGLVSSAQPGLGMGQPEKVDGPTEPIHFGREKLGVFCTPVGGAEPGDRWAPRIVRDAGNFAMSFHRSSFLFFPSIVT